MNKSQELFYYYIQSTHYKDRAENVGSIKAWDNCTKAVAEMPENTQLRLTDLINDYGRTREEIGFVNGIRYGAEIIALCLTDNGGGDND